MRKIFFNVSYVGTNLKGVSRQVQEIGHPIDSTSVSGLLELALAKLFSKSVPDVYISSRTDAGVHAISNSGHFNVASGSTFHPSCDLITSCVNKFLHNIDAYVRIKNVQDVPLDFHARYNAKSRTYLYRFAVVKQDYAEKVAANSKSAGLKYLHNIPILESNRCYFVHKPDFDLEEAHKTTQILQGTHNFAAFMSGHSTAQNVDKETIRTIYKLQVRPGQSFVSPIFDPAVEPWNFFELFCHGQSFLYKQVRRLLSAILAVSQGKISAETVQHMLDNPCKESWIDHLLMAPAHGLYLLNVEYDPEDFVFKSNNLLEERRKKLKATETRVTLSDGRVFVERNNETGQKIVLEQKSATGFVVDTTPDLQIGCVLPGLLVGSQDVAMDQRLLELHNVTHVLSIGVPNLKIPLQSVVHKFLDLLDLPESPIEDKISEACAFIEGALAQSGGCVFVHCNAGVSRAPTVVIGYLIKCKGMLPEEALALVREKRPSVKPNEGFWKQLLAMSN